MVKIEDYIEKAKGKVFTLQQAQEFERKLLKQPTTTTQHEWIDLKTGNVVNFNY